MGVFLGTKNWATWEPWFGGKCFWLLGISLSLTNVDNCAIMVIVGWTMGRTYSREETHGD
uniref:Uncharacterized protein n=1 Tax=viral metagenome TaxID=1070528 RepID=A0A6M3L2V5_9ZZZZ